VKHVRYAPAPLVPRAQRPGLAPGQINLLVGLHHIAYLRPGSSVQSKSGPVFRAEAEKQDGRPGTGDRKNVERPEQKQKRCAVSGTSTESDNIPTGRRPHPLVNDPTGLHRVAGCELAQQQVAGREVGWLEERPSLAPPFLVVKKGGNDVRRGAGATPLHRSHLCRHRHTTFPLFSTQRTASITDSHPILQSKSRRDAPCPAQARSQATSLPAGGHTPS